MPESPPKLPNKESQRDRHHGTQLRAIVDCTIIENLQYVLAETSDPGNAVRETCIDEGTSEIVVRTKPNLVFMLVI